MSETLTLVAGFTGMILPAARSTTPAGFLPCDGAAVSRTTYAALFAELGTTFGVGNGTTTFNVPDLRGRCPIGDGTGSGLTARTRGATVGTETHTLDATQMPSHRHRLWGTTEGSSTNAKSLGNGGSHSVGGFSGSGPTGDWRDQNPATATQIVEDTGGGLSHPNMQPSLVVKYYIKF